jgi:hypothetical protein
MPSSQPHLEFPKLPEKNWQKGLGTESDSEMSRRSKISSCVNYRRQKIFHGYELPPVRITRCIHELEEFFAGRRGGIGVVEP